MYTMCKTYGITNNKRHGMGAGDKDCYTEECNSADVGGEALFSPMLPLMSPKYIYINAASFLKFSFSTKKKKKPCTL